MRRRRRRIILVKLLFSLSDPLPILEQSVIQQQKVSKLQVKFFFSTTVHIDSFENRAPTNTINLVKFDFNFHASIH